MEPLIPISHIMRPGTEKELRERRCVHRANLIEVKPSGALFEASMLDGRRYLIDHSDALALGYVDPPEAAPKKTKKRSKKE